MPATASNAAMRSKAFRHAPSSRRDTLTRWPRRIARTGSRCSFRLEIAAGNRLAINRAIIAPRNNGFALVRGASPARACKALTAAVRWEGSQEFFFSISCF